MDNFFDRVGGWGASYIKKFSDCTKTQRLHLILESDTHIVNSAKNGKLTLGVTKWARPTFVLQLLIQDSVC